MQYTEYIPHPPLQQVVKTIWVLEAEATGVYEYEKILPDGCPELLFHYGDPFVEKKEGKEQKQGSFFVYGQLAQFIELRPTGAVGVIGVKFHPWGLSGLTNMPQHLLAEQAVAVTDIFEDPHIKEIGERIAHAKQVQERVEIVQQFLLDKWMAVCAKTQGTERVCN